MNGTKSLYLSTRLNIQQGTSYSISKVKDWTKNKYHFYGMFLKHLQQDTVRLTRYETNQRSYLQSSRSSRDISLDSFLLSFLVCFGGGGFDVGVYKKK